jgi:hypothetical protein
MNEKKSDLKPESDIVYTAIRQFRGIRGRFLARIMEVLPYLLLLFTVLVIFITKDTYIMYSSMIMAVALSILALSFLMQSIPKTLHTLWIQESISTKFEFRPSDMRPEKNEPNPDENPDDNPDGGTQDFIQLEREYAKFINDFEDSLNFNLGQLISGAIFALILLGRSIYEFWKWLPQELWTGLIYKAGGWDALIEGIKLHFYVYFAEYSIEEPLRFWTGIMLDPILGFILGIIAWRMLITSSYIRKLGQNFDLNPQPKNPDKCGGFEPLGNLSLMNVMIISIWGAFLGGWIIIGSITKYGSFYTPMYKLFFWVPIIMAVLTFLLPLWGIHSIIEGKRVLAGRELSQLTLRIHTLNQQIFLSALNLEPEPSALDKELERLSKVYEENKEYPTWPFNYRILIAFITSQAVPLLGLTGIGQPTINIIRSLLDFINQFGGPR